MKQALELYIHIPFCEQKCRYCDFLSFRADERQKKAYVRRLCEEIAGYQQKAGRYRVVSVFFGGGTPSVLAGRWIIRIMEQIRMVFSIEETAEITVEVNPGTLTAEKLGCYRAAGINRLSFGLQSASDEELRILGRIHSWQDFKDSYALARDAGFYNINVDLMSALPGQSAASWSNTLEKVMALKPEHISAYSLIIEPGTPFYDVYGEDSDELPGEEEERRMYEYTGQVLAQHGYEQYEISNYALPGYACVHNIGYWKRTQYLGFGLGAASLISDRRLKNTDDMERYLKDACIVAEDEQLHPEAQMEEFMFLGLRMMEGISVEQFEEIFGRSLWDVYGEVIRRLEADRLLICNEGRVRLTQRGTDVSNYVFRMFLF